MKGTIDKLNTTENNILNSHFDYSRSISFCPMIYLMSPGQYSHDLITNEIN